MRFDSILKFLGLNKIEPQPHQCGPLCDCFDNWYRIDGRGNPLNLDPEALKLQYPELTWEDVHPNV